MEPYRTPADLVAALQNRSRDARSQLWKLLREPVDRLMAQLLARHQLQEDPHIVTLHALHLAEISLRFRAVTSVAGLTWSAFRAGLLMQLAKTALEPFTLPSPDGVSGQPTVPAAPGYASDTFFRPYAQIGDSYFGGDWYAGRLSDDGSLWVFLADVTGHGYYAHLLATALPSIWQRCWSNHPQQAPQPAELLSVMHELLSDCLPEGIFLECTLARLGPDGRVTIVPAGGSRLFVAKPQHRPTLLKFRGAWLGLRAPELEDQREVLLEPGEELLLTTDGLFDQLDGQTEMVTRTPLAQESLLALLRRLVERSLAAGPQKDDLTMVSLHRRTESPG